MVNQRQKLNRKVEETLTNPWKEWSAQAAEHQVLRAHAENRKKEGHDFYKMDEYNIQMVQEDLTEDFQALAKTHTMEIGNLLEEFNDDQLLLLIEMEKDFQETLPNKTEEDEMKKRKPHSTSNEAR